MRFDLDALMTPSEEHVFHDSTARVRRHRAQPWYSRSEAATRGGVHTKMLDKPICAIDGEGKTRRDGRHDYCLFCAMWPTGRRCIEKSRITSDECLDFIMSLPDDHLYLGYGLS